MQFWAEFYHIWRAELLSTVAIAGVAYLLKHSSDIQAGASLKIALLSVAIVLGCFALYHLIRAPWLLDAQKSKELAESMERLQKADAIIEQLRSPADRPRLVFEKWGQLPATHPLLSSGRSYLGQVLQHGFYFLNDGSRAYDVMIEPFAVGQSTASSALVPCIGREGFALVWICKPQPLQSSRSLGKWDLLEYMSLAAIHAHSSSSVYREDYTVRVRVVYHDGNEGNARNSYYSSATLAYIPSQHRLEFRDISHDKGSVMQPS